MNFPKPSLFVAIFLALGCEWRPLLASSALHNVRTSSGKFWGFDRKRLKLLAIPCLLGAGVLALRKATQKNSPKNNSRFLSHRTLSAALENSEMPRELESIMLEYSQQTEENLTRKRLVSQAEITSRGQCAPHFHAFQNSANTELSIVDSFSREPLLKLKLGKNSVITFQDYSDGNGLFVNEKYCAIVVKFNLNEEMQSFNAIFIYDRASGVCLYQLPISRTHYGIANPCIALSDDGKWVGFCNPILNKLIRWDLRFKEPRVHATQLAGAPFFADVAGITILANGSVWLSVRNNNFIWRPDQQDAQEVTDSPEAQALAKRHSQIFTRGDLNPQGVDVLTKEMLRGCDECPVLRPFAEYYAQRLNSELNKQLLWTEVDNEEQLSVWSRLHPDDPWIKGHLLEINNLLDPSMPKPALDIIKKLIASAPQHVKGYLLDISGVDRNTYFQKYSSAMQCAVTSHIPPA